MLFLVLKFISNFKVPFCNISRHYYILIERDFKSELSLKNIIKNKERTEDILPSADVHFDVQKQGTGSAYPFEKGEFGNNTEFCK